VVRKLDWGNVILTKAKLKLAIEKGMKDKFPNMIINTTQCGGIDDIKEK